MKKLITTLCLSLIGGTLLAQWTPSKSEMQSKEIDLRSPAGMVRHHFKLDLDALRQQLKGVQEMGKESKPVVISIPTLSGKIEKFNVYSFPVVVKELADRYQLGSYVGVGIDDPKKYIRFSVAPNDFQSMIITENGSEFIEPTNADKTLYGVHPKTIGDKAGFTCSTEENEGDRQNMNRLLEKGKSFSNQPTDFARSSDRRYRTLRLVMSVTGEYTQFHGGTVAGALAAIQATITRVNGVFERDFGLHLILQNFPDVIYTNPNSDPYSIASIGTSSVNAYTPVGWSLQLQNTLTANVGNDNYDIGHLFGASGGGGMAGCIGCVCLNPGGGASGTGNGKGSGYTSPANAIPQGDTFDIDYVAHEMGHQLGGNHTFSNALERSGVNVEPGSGSTIMGYAGITGGLDTDVQAHSDPFFHTVSIRQIQTNLTNRTCDVETPVTNTPPVIAALPTYNIPKGTAFVLTASATDQENDPLTYIWEQVDNATTPINKNNLGTTSSGATFRSVPASTSPMRYFPKLSSVLDGVLDNANNGWESVSKVARTTQFAVTVRDNHPNIAEQQTNYATQTIVVGNTGPFKVNTQYVYHNLPTTAIEWDVAGTAAAPYNVANVKIDYTTDNGNSWTVLSDSTPNDGSEAFSFPASMNGQVIKLRISSINNVFYAVGSISVTTLLTCDGTAPGGIVISNLGLTSAVVTWAPVPTATYIVKYKKVTEATWQTINATNNTVTLSNLINGTAYEVQVAAVCSGTTGASSASSTFTTPDIVYCSVQSGNATRDHIANISLANVMSNPSGPSNYTDYTTNPALQINLVTGNTYTLSVTKGFADTPVPEMVTAWIDFNRNGTFETSERILRVSNATTNTQNPVTASFTVPANAVVGRGLRMRVYVFYDEDPGYVINNSVCGTINVFGEVEDYNVVVTSPALATNEVKNSGNGIQIYPNPVSDILNVTKVSDKAAYKIYNAAGQLVGNGNINDGKINVSSLIKGVYVITIDDKGKEQFSSKFIKK
ncbi:MAG: M12 family metallo-peptidase [Chryseobacterium sp.]|jgi:hypothetical protein|uniref:reprolysin-like metallopeptidase n=1 Tax=Chryseobacterium sp. TaxID=1871047 RepID=UPI00281D962E|nr:M12 family metallo-peptidase [Chryseobacterium sp.]MDR2236732.1 M12 family metallo-peptidase [Chryseobacterium sp.]